MMNFQEAITRLLLPASGTAELSQRPAIIRAGRDGQPDRVTTFAEMEVLAQRAAAAFQTAGVKQRDNVVFCSPNCAELVAAILAAWRLGAVAMPVDYRITPSEVANIASRLSARAVFAQEPLGDLKVLPAADWPSQGPSMTRQDIDALDFDQPSLVILTSGTTGVPKGAVHDLRSLTNNLIGLGQMVSLSSEETAMLPVPVSHVLGLEVVLASIIFGTTIVFSDFIPAEFAANIARLKPTFLVGVPTIYGALTAMPIPVEALSSLRVMLCGGAPLPLPVAEQFQAKFKKRINQGFGTTETKIIAVNLDGPLTSIGTTSPDAVIEIVNEQEQVLPEGEVGELRVRGKCLMLSYLNQPEATASVLHDGHYHTGDMGYIKDGYVFINGRSKDMIIVAGNKIYPSEVESVLLQHPLTAEVAVVGVPHSRLGQLVKAVIVVKPGPLCDKLCGSPAEVKEASQELESKYRAFCKDLLKRELRPMDWEFRPVSCPLPKTNTGKVDKKMLDAGHAGMASH